MSGNWRGPGSYIAIAFATGLINSRVLNDAVDKVPLEVSRDLKGVTAGLTGLSILGLGLQFIYARAIGPGSKAKWSVGIAFSFLFSILSFVATFVFISAATGFKVQIAALVSTAVFMGLVPSSQFASLLVNQRWIVINFVTILGALTKATLWKLDLLSQSLSGLLLGMILSNFIVLLVAMVSVKTEKLRTISVVRLTAQPVPVGILSGIIIVIAGGSVTGANRLGNDSGVYADANLVGRQVFYIVVLIAYAVFPALCNSPLFSRELGKSYRQAQVVATFTAIGTGIVLWQTSIRSEPSAATQEILLMQILAWVFFSISLIPLLYFISHNSRIGLAVLFPAIVMVCAQLVAHSAIVLSIFFLISTSFMLFLALVPALLRNRPVVHAIRKSALLDQPLSDESVTVVIPSYNPGPRVLETVWAVFEAFEDKSQGVKVIAVSDGSTDDSVALLDSINQPWFSHICLQNNVGKGGALRTGFAAATTSYVGFIDADGDIPPRLLPAMFATASSEDADVVFGSKWHPSSDVIVSSRRHQLSRFHHVLQVALFKLDISDTQVGIKVYKTESLRKVLDTLSENGFSLDLEIFVSLSAHEFKKFVEVPVTISRSGESTISMKSAVGAFVDMMRIFWRSRIALRYDSLAYATVNEPSGEMR